MSCFNRVAYSRGYLYSSLCNAKQSGTNESYVFVYENGIAAKKIINIVKSIDDEIIVTGINTGEQVITAGKTKVQDGDILTIDRSEK